MLEELKNKKVLILGFEREGMDNFLFLRKLFPKKVLGIADKSEEIKKPDKNVRLYLGKNYLKAIRDYDVVLKSPGIPFKILPRTVLGKITTQTEIFFENCPGKIVGITGTKGKSTTTSLIYKILKRGGIKAHLVGNIGKPVSNLLFSATPNDVYIYELSSHQLYNLKKSPHIAVFLNIYQEHLDYYRNFNEYVRAKANITRYQNENDYLVYNSQDKIVREIAKKSKAKKIPIPANYEFLIHPVRKSSISNGVGIRIPLVGKFNLKNIMAAVAVGKIFGLPLLKIAKTIENFKPLPHRLEYIGTYKGIKFYNDSLSTIPETTIAALDGLGNNVETIFLGGFDRGISFKNLAKRILKSKIKNLILFPTTGEGIWREIVSLKRKNKFRAFLVQNMKDAVKLAYQYTRKGKICLLSCASTSFSIFRNYKEKGNLFKKYVKKFAKG